MIPPDFLLLLAQSGATQTEYPLAWALIGGLLFLGFLVVGVPRPRASELPESMRRRREFRPKQESKPAAAATNKVQAATAFQQAIAQLQQQQQKQ